MIHKNCSGTPTYDGYSFTLLHTNDIRGRKMPLNMFGTEFSLWNYDDDGERFVARRTPPALVAAATSQSCRILLTNPLTH